MKDIHDYKDIMHQPYQKSKRHPWMSVSSRAGQFAPFAALNGHQEKIKETEKYEVEALDLDGQQLVLLDFQLKQALQDPRACYEITYYHSTHKQYEILKSPIKDYDELSKCLLFKDHSPLPLTCIYCIIKADE